MSLGIDARGCALMLVLCMPYSEVEEFEANFHQEALKGLVTFRGRCSRYEPEL